jgi:AraC-like DNA-binding protein
LAVDKDHVISASGVAPQLLKDSEPRLSLEDYMALIGSLFVTYGKADWPIKLGLAFVGPISSSANLVFQYSKNLRRAVQHFLHFEGMRAPVVITSGDLDQGFYVDIDASVPDFAGIAEFAAMKFVWLVASYRLMTTRDLQPIAIILPSDIACREEMEACLNVKIAIGPQARMIVSAEDADRVFYSHDEVLEQILTSYTDKYVLSLHASEAYGKKVRETLQVILPEGNATIAGVADRLAMSQRNLQRKLSEENTSFQAILYALRSELPLRYLYQEGKSKEETSALLGFQNVTSFYRFLRTSDMDLKKEA